MVSPEKREPSAADCIKGKDTYQKRVSTRCVKDILRMSTRIKNQIEQQLPAGDGESLVTAVLSAR